MTTETPVFHTIETDSGPGITYDCGCECTPTAIPGPQGEPGSEHCCCGRVHFAGQGASEALDTYLAERRATRRREPEYTTGSTTAMLVDRPIEVAWAFPVEPSA